MISKNKIKYIRSLERKKMRSQEGVFIAEGPKLIEELLGHFSCTLLAGTSEWWKKIAEKKGVRIPNDSVQSILSNPPLTTLAEESFVVTSEELSRISLQKHPQDVIALFRQPHYFLDVTLPNRELCLALDEIQDPGNLGTIIRVADWFGIETIFCSPGTVDVFNPKVVQATMGALSRVKVHYLSLSTFLQELINKKDTIPVYGTFLEGENIYTASLSSHGILLMGNEGNGISPELKNLINQKLYIPNYPPGRKTTESLNVAIATSIACAEFRRRG